MTVDSDDATVVLLLLFAVSTTHQRWWTAEELAQCTHKAESTWRNLAADGKIIGAKKAGKTWIFPELALQAYGVAVPSSLKIDVEREENE